MTGKKNGFFWPCRTHGAPAAWAIGLSLLGVTAVRVLLAAFLPLWGDEPYYWVCSRFLDWSFRDHPGLGPALIALGTWFLGDTPFGIRAGAVAVSILHVAVSAALARRLHPGAGPGRAAAAVWLIGLFPAFAFTGFMAFPYASLLLGWTGACWMALVAVEEERPLAWFGAGFFLAVALYSQISAILIVPGIFVWLLRTRPGWLRRVWPYLGVLLAAALFAPVLVWSWSHRGGPFAFQFASRHDLAFEPAHLPVFLGFQLLLASPLLAVALFFVGFRRFGEGFRGAPRPFVSGLSFLGLLAIFALHGMTHERILIHWSIPAYALIVPDAAGGALRGGKFFRRAIWATMILYAALAASVYAAAGSANAWGIPTKISLPGGREFGFDFLLSGFRPALAAVERERAARGASVRIFSNDYVMASQFHYHLRGRPKVFLWMASPGNGPTYADHYGFPLGGTGWDAIFAGRAVKDRKLDQIGAVFDRVTRIEAAEAPYGAWFCEGFKGRAAVEALLNRR